MRPICRLPVSTIALVSSLMLFGTEKAAANFNEIQGIIKPQLNIEWSRHIRQIVRDIGGTRFISQMNQVDTSDAVTEPAGIYTVVPTADLATSQSAVGWNVWLDGNAGYLEDTNTIRAYDGSQLTVSLGVDTQAHEKLTIGLIASHTASDITNSFLPGGSNTSAIGVGPYMALFLSDTVVFTGSFLYKWTDNDAQTGITTASYDSEDWSLNGTITSYHFSGNWQFAPSIGVSYNEERDEAYSDSGAPATSFPASTTRTGTFAFGGAATYTHTLESGMTIQPSLSVEGEWNFLRSVTSGTSSGDTQEVDVNLTGGIDFQLSNSVSLSVSSTVSGLAKPDYLSVIGGGRLSVSF